MYSCVFFSLLLDLHRSPPKDLSLPRASADAPIPLGSFRSCSTPKRRVWMVDNKCAWNLQFQYNNYTQQSYFAYFTIIFMFSHPWRKEWTLMKSARPCHVQWKDGGHWKFCSMWQCTTETSLNKCEGTSGSAELSHEGQSSNTMWQLWVHPLRLRPGGWRWPPLQRWSLQRGGGDGASNAFRKLRALFGEAPANPHLCIFNNWFRHINHI